MRFTVSAERVMRVTVENSYDFECDSNFAYGRVYMRVNTFLTTRVVVKNVSSEMMILHFPSMVFG